MANYSRFRIVSCRYQNHDQGKLLTTVLRFLSTCYLYDQNVNTESRRRSLVIAPPTPKQCIAVLGRRDNPTDAVEEYCRYLSLALATEGVALEIFRVRWPEVGWAKSMRELHEQLRNQKNIFFLVQYTALSWSKRGFPTRVLRLIRSIKRRGARCAIVFHDAEPFGGDRWLDVVRGKVQLLIMRESLRLSDLAVLTVPRDKVSWIPAKAKNVVFIPVGANLPAPQQAWARNPEDKNRVVAVFSITGDDPGSNEIHLIAGAIRHAMKQIGSLKLVVLGRNSEVGGEELRKKLIGTPAEVDVLGLLPAEEIVRVLCASDVLLFVRGAISSRRGSAIAGIACGLPVIAEEGRETASPITEAGVVLVRSRSPEEFGQSLVHILTDSAYRVALAERSRDAQKRYFSWSVIAAQYAKALRKVESGSQEADPIQKTT
jgi:glycosyltransferase involved in cell wall biosynthesis